MNKISVGVVSIQQTANGHRLAVDSRLVGIGGWIVRLSDECTKTGRLK